MKKKNIILISIVFVVVVICILAAVIGFGLSDKPNEKGKSSVNLSQNKETTKETSKEASSDDKSKENESDKKDEDEEETTEEVTQEEETKEKATKEETTNKEEFDEEPTEVETTAKQDETEEETTASVQTQELSRLSYEYMIIDGKSVYAEYNIKIMDLYESINAERISAGMSALTFDTDISYVACARASQVAFENVIEGSSDVKYYDLMGKSGVVFSKAVENTAAGYESAKEVVSGKGTSWKTSEKHYDNMISDKYTRVGVGVDYSETMGYVWVAIFSN